MLAVMEQAQGAGQKAQQDALIGQGSIFDLDPAPADRQRRGRRPGRRAAPWREPDGAQLSADPPEEFDQAELLAVEKEAIGLFISAHPLKPLREAMRARVDCPLAALADRRDKDWVTVGGIITEAKRIRTRNGDHMMFATLDDLEGRWRSSCSARRWPSTRRALRSIRSCSCAAASTTRRPARPAWSCSRSRPSRPARRRSSGPTQALERRRQVRRGAAEPVHLRVDLARSGGGGDRGLQARRSRASPAAVEVVLELIGDAGRRWRLKPGRGLPGAPGPALHAELAQIFPSPAIESPAPAAALARRRQAPRTSAGALAAAY